MKTIAIIDDDIHIGNMLEEVLHREGYLVLRAYSGTEALYLLSQHRADLILLDLMLPGLSGEELLPHIHNLPIIVISAKIDVQDKVRLLLGGAADYLTKPFDIKELLARITVQLRKHHDSGLSAILSVDDLKLDPSSHEVSVGNCPVKLTKTEYAILKLLMRNPGQVIAKAVILERITEDTPDCTDSSLKQHISNLRRKLRAVNGRDYIEAVWGIGFKLTDSSSTVQLKTKLP
ncbi:MAG: response regulator transcription factor [Lachnospiraceae bacterium]|jgi:DNA-binding response OmpR family regulator|uniref:response regulator transcription factor n=1 Tax=Hominisplanchenecus murintestinalis TaxID=2941517 RepID=UPI000EA25F54|nr:response regulator transcription factor [Hominisplanchenecus murintestinalis]MCI9516215.1 response regulator transcription factor [Lachnospiraceae bacterium]RKJ94029.1 DNA-binding response regulator [Anaerotruncus sp. 1XD22-93]MCI9660606.1 response regulator transcription factor [Lachnospiraceae bacterium]NBH97222.1 DNA-binding response regulator [Lachnospiraceae bacterium]NBI75084.1 DNA-binding response regulator [Lachnospiraceae bacterium]